MDPLDERLNRLLKVKGFGEGRIRTLVDSAGGVDELVSYLDNGDVAALSSVERISERTAVELILAYKGEDPSTLLRTEGSWAVYKSIVDRLMSYMNTSAGMNRTSLMIPCGDLRDKEKEAGEIFQLGNLVEGKDKKEVTKLLKSLGGIQRSVKSKLDYILLAEDEQALKSINKLRLDRRCLVLTPEEIDPAVEGELVYVYSTRELDETQIPLTGAVHHNSTVYQMVPETVYDLYGGRESQLKALSRLEEIFGREGSAPDALSLIEDMKGLTVQVKGAEQIRDIVENTRIELEMSMKEKIEGLTLSGTDTLSILASEEPPALREIYRDYSKKAADMVHDKLGQKRDLFRMGYPLRTDEEILERMISEMEEEARSSRFERKQDLAEKLASMWESIEEELSWALDLDFRFGLGCFVKDHELYPFKVVDGWLGIFRACHLLIRENEDRQLVDYHLGEVPGYAGTMFPFREVSSSRTSLLTGANSGGKTTLLETLAQVLIMARMGLPVPADKAYIPDIEDLFFYRPRRRLDAGGLEGFLKELLPLSMQVDRGSMVLADELEAMTELEAASRMIGVFVDELQRRDAYSVVVTHMADEITRFVECRVDGIEARGLDEGHELIVDRSPMIGRHAKSTPELILRKLHARSSGDEKDIYSRVLSYFEQ